MKKEELRQHAARLVAEGFRRAAALTTEAVRDRRMADMVPGIEGDILRMQAAAKWKRAARTRQLCGRLAAAHDIGTKKTGAGQAPRPVVSSARRAASATNKRRVAYAL